MKNQIISATIDVEGGFVDDPADSGGATKFGITERVARRYGYGGDMRDLSRETAFDIYAARYWDPIGGDGLLDLSEAITREVYDTGVNMGTGRAAEFLQRALNVFNDRERLYPDIKVDGDVGPATLGALRSYLAERKESVMLRALNSLQGAYYIELAERRTKDERFAYGWFDHRVKL